MGCSLISFVEFIVFGVRVVIWCLKGDNRNVEPSSEIEDEAENDEEKKNNSLEIGYINKGLFF